MTEFVQRTLSLFEAWSVPPDRATSLVDQLHRDITHAALSISDNKQLQPALADTIGAGDSWCATLVVGLLRGLPAPQILAWANRVASFVASQRGATPTLPVELRRPL